MDFKLLRQILFKMSIRSLQALMLNCLLLGTLYASNLNAQQIKSVKEVAINLKIENADLVQVLQNIEYSTDYKFSYRREDIDQDFRFSGKFNNASVADVLLEISRQTDLKFKQVNNNIHISKRNTKTREDQVIEIIIQGITITGKVTSSEDQSGLPGVNVIVKGTSQGTVTDVEGNYTLEVSDENSIIVFSFVGFIQEEVNVRNQTVINITMNPDVTALEEIVVTGYGVQKKVN
ncbi:MAG: carboxypeptidase-like regulatory domain-containing protein, partial [Cyclobacteriaceae bacterium]|nr:carboxypeptidase-like regulatory domain-containing protein [Cyclobacteriaceae bacterium]